MRKTAVLALAAAFAAAGCFNEPEPAGRTVPAEARIYLSDRGLVDLTDALAGLKPDLVDYLNLDRNALEDVAGVERLTKLKWLRLNGNRLERLPDLGPLTSLRRLYLRDNRLAEVPASIETLPALTDLDLSGNPIEAIPDWLAAKKGLENLSFSRTRLTKLPDDLSAWKSLTSLQLGELSLPAEEMARIRSALPDTAIVF